MCTFISATVNEDTDRGLLMAALEAAGFKFEEVPVPKQMPPGRQYLAHMSGHCDCGTAIGAARRKETFPYTYADVEKLRRQGWSEGKINRWTQQKIDAAAKNERSEQDRLQSVSQELRDWCELIRKVLTTPTVKRFGIMHDFYSSGPGYEDLPLTVEAPGPIAELEEGVLFRLPEGTLIEWTR
jgi:hypothetical protein